MATTPEGKVKRELGKALKHHCPKLYVYMPVKTLYGSKTVDYLICCNGRFVAIEAKAPGQEPTPLQKEHLSNVDQAGGITFVVDSKESAWRTAEYLEACTRSQS
jgi:hypothetical protein